MIMRYEVENEVMTKYGHTQYDNEYKGYRTGFLCEEQKQSPF